MRVLLDTQVLFWAIVQPGHLSSPASSAIADEHNQVCASAASAWELATKVRIGKFPAAEKLERNFLEYTVERAGYELLPISVEEALRAGRLPGAHRDPFDRMIAAQALANDLLLISNDSQLDFFGVRRLW